MRKRATNSDGSKVERRKGHRFPVSIPVEAGWRGEDGKAVKQDAVARQVNMNGGFLEMSAYPEVGTRISVMNLLSAETAEARVLATPYSREGVSQGIIVELVVPSESFWGVNLQVKKTTMELQKLEDCLRTEGIDLRLLKEFRDSIEYIHFIGQMVQRLRQLQLRNGDSGELQSLLTAERLRHVTNLCLGLLADFDAGKVDPYTKGLEEFNRCVNELSSNLNRTAGPIAVSARTYVTSKK